MTTATGGDMLLGQKSVATTREAKPCSGRGVCIGNDESTDASGVVLGGYCQCEDGFIGSAGA